MNNEIGRKITSLTLMAIMVAGGLTFAVPGVMPAAHAANANLFVSAENSQFDNYMSGPQVIEVVVIDSDINETDESNGEPDVTVNGKILRMVQAVDGNWYGYFADRTQAQTADATTSTPGTGLDFGTFCANDSTSGSVDFTDTVGIAIPGTGGSNGQTAPVSTCAITGVAGQMNVLREFKDINDDPDVDLGQIDVGAIGHWPFIQLYNLNPTGNVIVQYNKGGGAQTTTLTFDTAQDFASLELDRAIYGQGMEVHATITDLWLNIDPTDEDSWTFAANEDSGLDLSYYQVFDENGLPAGDGNAALAGIPLNFGLDGNDLDDLMCDDNCILFLDPNQQGGNDQITLQDNDDSEITATVGTSNPEVIGDFETINDHLQGAYPVTVTEQGPNSGVFSTSDEGDVSSLRIVSENFVRGESATIEYNDSPVSILTGYITGSVDIQPVDDEWSSGEEIPVVIDDHDLNLNSRADEDLDLFNPDIDHIPTLQTGSPLTLENINSAIIDSATPRELFAPASIQNDGFDNPEAFSQRVFLETDQTASVGDGNTINIELDDRFEDLYDTIAEDGVDNFLGVNLINFDVRSLVNALDADSVDVTVSNNPAVPSVGATFVDAGASPVGLDDGGEITGFVPTPNGLIDGPVTITDGTDVAYAIFTDDAADGLNAGATELSNFSGAAADISNGPVTITQGVLVANDADAQSLLNLESAGPALFDFADNSPVHIVIEINSGAGNVDISTSNDGSPETMPIVVDFFSFGFFNDGEAASDRVANQIVRIEAEETGDNTGIFEGSLEYTMINQLNILDADTYEDLSTIADDPTFIVIEDLTDEDAPRVNYLEIIDDGVPTNRADQEEAPSHSGIVSFDNDNYKVADTVYITLEDQDLNVDSDLLEIYTTVDSASRPATFGMVGSDAFPEGDNLSFGPLGRLLDVTFDDVQWKSPAPTGTCTLDINDTGLDAVTFSMVETGSETGVFVGSFEIPDRWCRDDNATPETTTGLDIEVNYVDFRDASGEIIEVGDSAGVRANTGSISLDRTVYPVPFGVPSDFATSSEVSPDGRSIFPIHLTGMDTAGTPRDDAGLQSGEFLPNGDLAVHLRVNDPDFDVSGAGEDAIASNRAGETIGPVEISVIRGSETVILGYAGGDEAKDGVINVGTNLLGDGEVSLDELTFPENNSGFQSGETVTITQSGNTADATAVFNNIGVGDIQQSELVIDNNINGQPMSANVDIVQGVNSVTATFNDDNGDTNVDDGEITNIATGPAFTNGLVDIEVNGNVIAQAIFTDVVNSIEPGELGAPVVPGSGFETGQVTITGNTSNASMTADFVDDPIVRQFGPIDEIAPDAGIFELDLTIRYTDGPADTLCPETANFEPLDGTLNTNESARFSSPSGANENYCILQGDILQVEYEDPTDASGDLNTVTDSATFDLRNGVLQSDKSVYIIGSDIILTLIEPDLDLDNDGAETWDLDLIEWDSDAATVTMGDADGEGAAFDPEPSNFRETGDSTGIFQIVIETPEILDGDRLERGEEVILEYTDWGPSGSDYVGDEDEDVNLTLYTSNFGATVELDQKVYSWTDKSYITIVAPDHNFDSDLVDEIGNTDLDPIKVSTRGADLDNYKLVETGTDTGIFTGEVILTGFTHDADGDSTTGDANGNDVVSQSPTGDGPTDGLLPADDDDGLTVSFEFSEDETVVGSALIRWNIGEVQWLEASYPASGTGVVRVIDPDMNLDPEAVDNFDVDVWSDSDAGGIDLTVTETNEATGIFEGTVFFTVTDESSGHRLRVAEGDTVTAEYEDNTLPDPYTTADELDITATSLIGTVVPPLERAPIVSCRVVDAFGNTLSSVSVDQQVQITCDLANGQDREQQFAYLVQIQDDNGVTVQLAWITGSLAPGQSFSPAQSWIPDAAGSYDATAFVWESVDNPTALSPPVTTPITVN